MKISFTVDAETNGDLVKQLAAFLGSDQVTEVAKPAAEAEKTKKAAAAKMEKVEDKEPELDLSEAGIRAAFKQLDWPAESKKAFLIKFGFPAVSEVPKKRYTELLELLKEAQDWPAKKLSAYIEPEDNDI